MDEIEISPGQFILMKDDSLYKNYNMKEKIGEGTNFKFSLLGAFGVVYKATHKITGEQRAIKFIDRTSVSPEKEVKLMQEIEILKKLVAFLSLRMIRIIHIL